MWWPFRSRTTNLVESRPIASSALTDLRTLDVAVLSDRGNHRQNNEDRGRATRPGDEATLRRKGVLVLVADGMGGHEAGEVASATAAETITRTYYASPATPENALRQAFVTANEIIHSEAQRDPGRNGMGTTCTALAMLGGRALVAHVGDSRLYRLRSGSFDRLTEDHSVVGEMVRDGLLSEAQARDHESRNVITRALGIRANVDVSVYDSASGVEVGDVFVLMSDGLYDLVRDEEIAELAATPNAHDAASAMIDLANIRGGYDNVTVGVVRVLADVPTPQARETREAPALP